MLAYQDIFDRRKIGEQPDVLIGPRNSQVRDAIGKHAYQEMITKDDIAALRFVKTGNAIEQRGFTSSVWPDNAVDAMFSQLQVQFVDCNQASKNFCDFLNFKYGIVHGCLMSRSWLVIWPASVLIQEELHLPRSSHRAIPAGGSPPA